MTDDRPIINEIEQKPNNSVLVIQIQHNNGIKDSNAPALQKMIIDSHEPEALIESLKQEKGIYVEVKELASGDYVFSNIGVERKTLKDFYGSIVHGDKRIWQQMYNLKRCFERPILVIERWDDSFLIETYKLRTVLSAMSSIVMQGISVVVLPGQERDWKPFIDFLAYMFYASDKKEPSLKPVPKKGHQETVLDVREDMVCMIPMLGRKKSKEILSRYTTIEELCKADENDIRKRLGPKTGQMLIEVLKKKFETNDNDKKQYSSSGTANSNQVSN